MTKQDNMKVFMRRTAMTMLLAVFTVTAWAQDNNPEYEYVERSWEDGQVVSRTFYTYAPAYTIVELTGNNPTEVKNLNVNTWYVVTGNVTYDRLIVDEPEQYWYQDYANIILCDGATLNATITVNEYCKLRIYGQEGGTGKLIAKTHENDESLHSFTAAIGSEGYVANAKPPILVGTYWDPPQPPMGTLEIHGGIIDASAKREVNGNEVEIGRAAAIGGGELCGGGIVTIYGGTVTATGGRYAAGIGGGMDGNGGTLTVYGGTVTATGGTDAAGIGSGEQNDLKNMNGGTVRIYGGTVTATGGEHGAGIGGGQDASGADVEIYGGNVTAKGGTDAAGIGSGEEYVSGPINGGSLKVYGGTVYADGTETACGIGGGQDADGANVEIYGGTVIAWCGNGSRTAAIGSNLDRNGSLYIDNPMMVHAGSSPSSNSLFPYSTRVPACWYRDYAKIEVCDHPSGLTYTVNANNTHTTHCKHCLTSEEVAHFDYDGNGRCVCGHIVGVGVWTITLAKPGIDANGNFNNSYSGGTNFGVATGQAFTLPECDVNVNFYTFKGWVVGSESTSLEASEGATFLYPGDNYTPTADVTIKAHYEPFNISLADNADNSEVLYMNNGKKAKKVTLSGRILYKDGKWNTLCLPFDVDLTANDCPLKGNGVEVRTLSFASFNNGTLTLDFTPTSGEGSVTTMTAGKPYIIKWYDTGETLTNLEFNDKTIRYARQDVVCDLGNDRSITFRGTYASTTYTDTKPSILFLGGNNKLYYPQPDLSDTENPKYPTIGAQRAYFQLTGLQAGEPNNVRAFILNFGDGSEANGIKDIAVSNPNPAWEGSDAWFSLDGRRLAAKPAKPGVYIVNGRKVVIK